jgi:hypothetical protein
VLKVQVGPNAYPLGWVFTRSGGTSSQQVELIGSNVNGGPFGTIVAVSADGNTAIAGVALDCREVVERAKPVRGGRGSQPAGRKNA